MPNDSTQPGQGPDLSKLVTDIQKIGAVLRNPALQKLLGGGAVTLDEMLSVLPVLGQLLPGHGLTALPPPAVVPAPVIPAAPADPAPLAPAPAAPVAAPSTTSTVIKNAMGGLLSVLTGLGLGAADVIGTPVGPSATLVGQLWPLVSIGLAAVGVPAPIAAVAQRVLGAVGGAILNRPKA